MKHSLDRYLYVIGLLKQKQEYVCAADVGRFLGVKASAVSLALRKLLAWKAPLQTMMR